MTISKVADRTVETTTTTGTGTITLAGAKAGYRSFSQAVADGAITSGDSVVYCETDGTNWEVWEGIYTLAGTTLTKVTLQSSSNGGAAISWGAGSKDVFLDISASSIGSLAFAAIHLATSKTTPVDADEVGIWDSVSVTMQKLTWANLKATLKTYFDTLYAALAGSSSQDFAVNNLTASGTITPHSTKGIVGTTTNDNAQSGSVGEYIESVVTSASAVALTSGLFSNITTISLSPGDWDVVGNTFIQGQSGVTSYTRYITGISLTSATGETPYQTSVYTPAVVPATVLAASFPTAMRRVTVASGTTTVYLLGSAAFTAGTASAYGFISARRVR